jgi:Type II secretion system (T2SS), protein G
MWRDALRTVAIAARRFVLGAAFLCGAAVTVRVAWFGWHLTLHDVGCSFHCCYPRGQTAKMRVMQARDAVTQYMIETPSCPHSIDELVAGRYLDRGNAKDPWGSPLKLTCPGRHDTEGADVESLGPDKQLDTADDIKSWDP